MKHTCITYDNDGSELYIDTTCYIVSYNILTLLFLKIIIITKCTGTIDSIPKNNSAFCLKTSYFMNK